jgi:hypothetical protein
MTALAVEQQPAFSRGEIRAGLRARIEEERVVRPREEEPDPISPELVLVSPPEVARLAREALPDPVVAPRVPAEPRPVAAARRVPVGAAAFWVLCVANALAPLGLAIVALS